MDTGLLIDLVVGLIAGIVSGLLGVGGGIILTPVLHYYVGLPWNDAVALSLFVIALQSPIGVWRHARRGAVDWKLAIPLTLGGAAGVGAGLWLLPRTPVTALKLLFAALLVGGAWRMTRTATTGTGKPHTLLVAGFGVLAGIVSRLLGVGGGIVTVPLLGLAGVAVHVAVGTSLVPVFTNAAIASGGNLATGLAWSRGIGLAIGAIGGTVLGVRIAHALPEKRLRKTVSVAMIMGAAAILIEVL
jgi:uncharacterized membrane protein YfcA